MKTHTLYIVGTLNGMTLSAEAPVEPGRPYAAWTICANRLTELFKSTDWTVVWPGSDVLVEGEEPPAVDRVFRAYAHRSSMAKW